MRRVKQVIVMRRKFPDGKGGTKNVRTGKLIAQGAHASMKAILDMMFDCGGRVAYDREKTEEDSYNFFSKVLEIRFKSAMHQWLEGGFAKIAVYVDTEEELLGLYQKAKDAKLPCSLITDYGRTEFGGVPTNTCIAIGPSYADEIDKITGELKLL